MAIERKLIKEAIDKVRVKKFVLDSLDNVGVGSVDVKRTPLGTRIIVTAVKPGLVIGRKGKNIQMLTSELSKRFKIENPQIEVQEVEVPEFNPAIMAEQLVSTIERGIHFRRASHSLIKRIMGKGALGVLIEISGKLSGERSRKEKFMAGYIKYSGETALQSVSMSVKQAKRKAGVIGIKIRLAPPADPVKLAALVFDDSHIVSESIEMNGKKSEDELQKLQDSISDSSNESADASSSKPDLTKKELSKVKKAKAPKKAVVKETKAKAPKKAVVKETKAKTESGKTNEKTEGEK
ncbi:TPA: 30S ribosomal protein S3 [archaeon]|jgi:small subunit ribosomal protein S3|uniref:Small ribosomal subunit protein uS3 n=1 Tax=Candidatus Undinarchaeum marinum TaxID=2756141 RepID=A0A832V0P6_9ARCH|nr:30S ribosomal protein S3 [Candidatus Undinarchaeum marinum]